MTQTYTVVLEGGGRFGPADMDLLKTWAAQGRIPANAMLEPVAASEVEGGTAGGAIRAGHHPALAGIINAPPTVAGPVGAGHDTGTDATGGIIPYKNPKALIAYYCGVASLIGVVLWGIGLAISLPALIFGIAGLRAHKRDPRIRGVGHAWAGIILGGVFTLLHLGLILFLVITLVMAASNA